jgi:hypothetical protein
MYLPFFLCEGMNVSDCFPAFLYILFISSKNGYWNACKKNTLRPLPAMCANRADLPAKKAALAAQILYFNPYSRI